MAAKRRNYLRPDEFQMFDQWLWEHEFGVDSQIEGIGVDAVSKLEQR